MIIIPAILPKNQTELNTKVKSVIGLVSHVQVDVCDGVFVPSKTKFDTLPQMENVEYELDLMIAEPEKTLESFIDMQPARLIVHLESVKDIQKLFMALERVRGIIEVGLSISNDTPNAVLEQYLDDCDFIQLMGIATIGKQGQPFDERVIEKIKYFHTAHPGLVIAIDGAVSMETINKLKSAGATRFVAGSAVFGEGDIQENVELLTETVVEEPLLE